MLPSCQWIRSKRVSKSAEANRQMVFQSLLSVD